MLKDKNRKIALSNESDYKIIIQLYYLNKTDKKREARLPANDFRRPAAKKITPDVSSIPLRYIRRSLLKIAAMW